MKRYLKYIGFIFFTLIALTAQSQFCCPKFTLGADFQPCDSTCTPGPNGGAGGNPTTGGAILTACKNHSQTYTVYPNLPGFTFVWTVLGGTPGSFTGNPNVITWGNSSSGFIQVIISNPNGCRDTIIRRVCLSDGPIASFTFSPNPVCLSPSFVQFTNTSVGGSSYYWDFGDGSSSTLQSPTHAYTVPGPHTVILTVSTASGGGGGGTFPPERDCKCRDTASAVIMVSNLSGIDIHPADSCKRMICNGDTTKYCTSTAGCTGLSWSVNGGTIIGPTNTTCVTVHWNLPSTYPTTVTLNATCPGTCGNSATISVPVLYPNLPIQGPNPVCTGSTTNYSLPVLPGTFYKWTLNGGGNIIGADSNINFININWTAPTGTYIITCTYKNPFTGCSGTSTDTITIKPKFTIFGPSQACTGNTSFIAVIGGGSANWNVIPTAGYTPPGVPPGTFLSVSSLSLTWGVAGNYVINAVPTIISNYCTNSATINIVVNPTPVLNPIAGPTQICPNQITNYSVTSNIPAGPFVWTLTGSGNVSGYGPGNSNASVNFTGTGPWILQASQTVNGCTGTTTVNINAVPPPTAITFSPSATVCSGGSVTATATGGAPPYTWSSTPGAVLMLGQGTAVATFTVNSGATITVSNCGGSFSSPVNISPTTVTASSVINSCSATLSTSPGGGTYNWFLNGNSAGSGSPIVVNQPGTYVVQATYPGGCAGTAQVTVNFTPVVAIITASGNLCNGPVNLQAILQGNCVGATYTWSNGATGPSTNVNVAGSYSVTVVCNGCTVVSNIIVVPPCPSGGGVGGNCVNDAVITPNPSLCNNPVNLSVTAPGCTPLSTAWLYGDGFGGSTGTHYYNSIGTYTVLAVMTCADGSKHCGTSTVTIPMVDSFTHIISCGINGWTVQLQDASLFMISYSGYTTNWTTTCGTLNASNIPNPILTIPFGCNPTVTLTISKNGCTLTTSFTFTLPNTALSINGPSTVCAGVSNSYNSSFTTGVIAYNWNFSDGTTGITNPISHAFNSLPPNQSITLAITDQYGCIFTATKPITVITPTALTITPSPLVKICPDCAPPVTLTTSPLVGFTGYQWYHNGVAVGGANNPTYQLCNFDASGNYYVTAINTANNNCPVISDTVMVVYYPKPVADIQGQTIYCSSTVPASFGLANSVNDPNCTYLWTATGPGSVTYSPNNTVFNPFVTVSAFGNYQFILTVTNTITGCTAKDTLCLFVYQSPVVNLICPAGPLCEGTLYTFTATPFNPAFVYTWSNGVTGQTMTTGQAGTYFVTVTNPVSGCTATSSMCMIHERPNVSLFPLGCDTLCSKDTLIVPLPLGPFQTYPTQYTIQWYVDGILYYTGPFLLLNGLSLGQHQVYIVVTTIPWGCSSTSAKFNLFIKNCADCDCKGSHWGDITMAQGNNPPVKLKCNSPATLTCNLPYTINASFICKDTSCKGKVTYVLYPPSGSPITGNVPLNFTPVAGVYTLTLYGWCGDKKCDSCTIDLIVKCDCDCKGSKWGPITVAQGDIAGGDVGKAVIVTPPLNVSCGKTYDLKCNQPYTVNASFICKDSNCNSKVTYSLQPPTGLPITGTLPLTFTPNQNGFYVLTLYGWCGNKICDSCVISFNVKCNPCNCDGSHWGNLILNAGDNGGGHDDNPNNPIGNIVIGNPGNPIALKCNSTFDLICNKPYTVNANFICKDTNCNSKVTYSLQPPTGLPINGTLPLTFTPNQTGVYVLTLYGWCGNKICDSCVIKFNVKCDPCNCDGSHWGDITLNNGDIGIGHGGDQNNPIGNVVIGNPGTPIALKCKTTYNLVCNQPYTINASYVCKDPNCNGKVTYSLKAPTGLPVAGTLPLTFTPNQSGTYILTLYGWCGNKICDSCVIMFKVTCVDCDCKGSHWGEITATDGVKTTNVSCGKTFEWKCKVPFTVNAAYNCAKPGCNGSVSYLFIPAVGSPISGTLPYSYTPTQSGLYTFILYGMCGNKICDSCKFSFHVDCPVDTNCCKHDINIQAGNVTYTPNTNSTIAAQTFTITGLSGVNLSEVRAEVISYDLSSNYNNECLGCKTFPFTWASINSAGNIGAVSPNITLYGATTAVFNPTGSSVYQNPREVIWNNGNSFTITGPIGINFILPPTPALDCCQLSGKICVKFTFRDENCNECEVVVCFNVVIKK